MKTIVVAAAIVEREGLYLVTRRGPGTHLAGVWEFPGGKCEPGETLPDCVARELLEELAITAAVGPEVFATTHDYADRRVELHFLRCGFAGEAVPQLGQKMRWVSKDELMTLDLPPADVQLIRLLAGER
jgi:8-oxo-dGTP diphosphatase